MRGAIDTVGIADRLAASRAVPTTDWHVGLDAALVALSGRVRLAEACTRTAEQVVREIYESVFGLEPKDTPDTGDGSEPPPGEA